MIRCGLRRVKSAQPYPPKITNVIPIFAEDYLARALGTPLNDTVLGSFVGASLYCNVMVYVWDVCPELPSFRRLLHFVQIECLCSMLPSMPPLWEAASFATEMGGKEPVLAVYTVIPHPLLSPLINHLLLATLLPCNDACIHCP